MSRELLVAILAAGEAARFGGGKLDAMIGDRPLGRFALDSARVIGAGEPIIIVSSPPPLFARHAADAGEARLVENGEAQLGISTSVALAAKSAADAGSNALLLMLADMPLVRPATLRRLVDSAFSGRPAAVRHADGNAGIPACFTRDWFEALQRLGGDRGAAALLRQSEEVSLVEVVADELRDIDTEADLATLLKGFH